MESDNEVNSFDDPKSSETDTNHEPIICINIMDKCDNDPLQISNEADVDNLEVLEKQGLEQSRSAGHIEKIAEEILDRTHLPAEALLRTE